MFISDLIRRRLLALLRPCLQQEPELELELGFLRSRVVAKNLRLDCSVLNQSLDESTRFSFKEFKVDELSLRVSYWSVPTFTFEAGGVHVTLSAGEVTEEGVSRRKPKPTDMSLEDFKKILAEIDPEGSALHDALEKIMGTGSRNQTSSLLHVILQRCRFLMHDIHLVVQFPILNGSSCLLEIKELNAESQYTERGCFLRGLLSSIFVPLKKVSSFTLELRGSEIGLKSKEHVSRVASSMDLCSSMKLEDLRLIDFNLTVPEITFSFSPVDILIISAFGAVPSHELKPTRKGRQLWEIAATRIHSLSTPRLSLHKLVGVASSWLCYVHAYQNLLLLVGYPSNKAIKQSASMMPNDGVFSHSFENQWKVISEIEKKLPAHAIAQARRITRCRVALNAQKDENHLNESLGNSHFKFFSTILSRLALVWSIICTVFCPIIYLFLRKVSDDHPKTSRVGSEDCCPHHIYNLNIQKISIIFSPINAIQPSVGGKLLSDIGIPHSELLKFCFSIDMLFLTYKENICEQYICFSCGQLRAVSSFITEDGSTNNKSTSSQKGHGNRNADDVKAILWSEPAKSFCAIDAGTSSPNNAEEACVSLLENLLGQMWSKWKEACTKSKEREIQYSENPWVLCEIKNFLTDQSLKNVNTGFWECSLVVGKLNFLLGYVSILSIALLLRQLEHAHYWVHCGARTKVLSPTQVISEDLPVTNWDNIYKPYVERIMLKMLPEKNIQIGVFITGPHILLVLEKEMIFDRDANVNDIVSQEDLCLAVDVHNIEFAVWPKLKFDILASSSCLGLGNAATECLRLMEPRIIDISHSDTGIYTCRGQISICTYLKVNGLSAFFGGPAPNQLYRIITLNPVALQLATLRADFHSFSTGIVALSAALQGIFTGLAVSVYMDELFVLVKVFLGLFSAASHAFSIDLFAGANFQEFIPDEMIHADTETERTLVMSAKGTSLVSTLFVCNGTFKLKSMDMVLRNSRKNSGTETYTLGALNTRKLAMQCVPECGICTTVDSMSIAFSYDESIVVLSSDFSGIRSVIFKDLSEIGTVSDHFELRSLLLRSQNCLCEVSISLCTFALSLQSLQNVLPSGSASTPVGSSTSGGTIPYKDEEFYSPVDTERSKVQSTHFSQIFGIAQNVMEPAASHWLLLKVSVSEIYITGCTVKNTLVREQNSNKLEFSLAVGREFRTITCQIQGGAIFLEIEVLPLLLQHVGSYHSFIRNLLYVPLSTECIVADEDMAIVGDQPVDWGMVEAFTGKFSQFSLILVATDESGTLQELLFEADFHLNVEVTNREKQMSFQLSRFLVLSQILHKTAGQGISEIQISHFSPVIPSDSGDPKSVYQPTDGIQPVFDSTSCSSQPSPQVDSSFVDAHVLHLSHQNYILKQLSASLLVQKLVPGNGIGTLHLNQAWVGTGSISGFDMRISLREIQMLFSTVELLSGVFGKRSSSNVVETQWFTNQESSSSLEETVPDGAIVAIQDVHQHMYMAIEGVERKYNLVGAIHYSLVGERALFRVKYQSQRRWKSSVLWFSLISLYAKNDSGEPLRLNYRPGSGFVDISSTKDSGGALWRMLSCKPETYDDDAEVESYNLLAKSTFYLVNKKNDRAIAFVDGVPEFVCKPGNPFKWKVFNDLSLVRDVALREISHVEEERTSAQTGKLPSIVIMVDNVALTIDHELFDTKEKFPLLQVSVSSIELMLQILSAKARVLSSLRVLVYYFDAQRNLWEELVHPVEICVFYRSRFQIQGSGSVLHGVPVHFYARIKELGISITELSLDILLFVIGKLNLAGPYAIRSSKIFANCCKVDNQSSLDLLCQFYDNQNASIARRQSSIVVLRQLAMVNRPPEASYVSVQLAERGAFLTSPIHLSLLDAGALAWRTRIVSLQDSKTYPGPFVVIDILREIEDGLSITVSPLLRIHNETEFSMELRFQRPQLKQAESATVVLKAGDTIDDTTAPFDAITLSGGLKKALMSLSVGNFLVSFRPEISDDLKDSWKLPSVEWSEYLGGGKAVRLSGLFEKLSYKFRKAFSVEPSRCSFSTAHCTVKSGDGDVANVHFLIQCIRRDVPLVQPDNFGYPSGNTVALQEQKEIFLLPTVRVSNLLKSEIHVLLTDMDPGAAIGYDNIGKQATISCGSTVDLYANPDTINFIVTLTAFSSSCKPVNSRDWVKNLQKQKKDVYHLDIDLDFGGGKYFAVLRLSRGHRGILEVAIFPSYTLNNDTDFPLFCFAPNQRPLSRDEAKKLDFCIPPELGYLLPPKSARSWFMKYNKARLKLLEENASEILLDLDALSGLTEMALEVEDGCGSKHVAKLGVSLGPLTSKLNIPSQVISFVPRYIVINESEEVITVRQCYLEDDMEGMIPINSKQNIALKLRSGTSKKREYNVFENILRKHRDTLDSSLDFIQFRPNESGLGWSGPVCIASLGRFFLKFRRTYDFPMQQSNQGTAESNTSPEFATVHVVEEGSSLVMHYHRPPNISLPYRIENCLHHTFITYYQKEWLEPEILGSRNTVNYVWDDLTLPHKLVVQINDAPILREINLDKVRKWKPFYRVRQHRGFGLHLPLDIKPGDSRRTSSCESSGMGIVNVGYEVYADGPTRVLRICEFSGSRNENRVLHSSGKIRLRISQFAIHLLEHTKQEIDAGETSFYMPIIVTRLENINLDSIFTDQHKYNLVRVQSLSVDQKWVGAPFAAMLRRQQLDYGDRNVYIFRLVLVLLSSSSNVKQVKYSTVVLQPLDLNLDEETLMRIVPFWRTSLSNSQSQRYYFDHFEIHPIKIKASVLLGDSYSSYSSTQEMLRSLLHSVIKIPAIKNMNVELNGVLVTHALITIRELCVKCAQHYSWYAMRAIYIAKGSPLLPPAFASIFDDLASSSLDVFFDPSSVLTNLPGLTIGTFKLISKCVDGKGFSGTKRYFGDLGKTVKTAGSNILFAAVTEISDSVLKGAETSGFNGMVGGFHQGILKLAMEPSLLGTAVMEGGPDRKIKLDRSPGVDELYIEGYLQAMLDTLYKQEYLRVRVIDNQVVLKNLPPNSSLIDEIVDRVKDFLVSKALLKGDSSTATRPLRHLRGESEWRIGPTVLTLCEHVFVSFAIRMLRKQAGKFIGRVNLKKKLKGDDQKAIVPASSSTTQEQKEKVKLVWKWEIGKFVLSGIVAYIDGRLCRSIPNPVARRIVSGFLLSFLDKNEKE